MPVTAEQIKEKLDALNIPYEEERYDSRYDFWQALEVFADTKEQSPAPVLALIIKSANGEKHLSILFEATEDSYLFCDLFFGPFDFELFDLEEELVEDALLTTIEAIMKNEIAVIYAVDVKRQKWLWDGSFNTGDPDPHDRDEFEQAVKRIEKPKSRLDQLLNRQTQYDVYDWNTCRRIVK